MSDLWQCYLVGLISGVVLSGIPVAMLWGRLRRISDADQWARWWIQRQRRQQNIRR